MKTACLHRLPVETARKPAPGTADRATHPQVHVTAALVLSRACTLRLRTQYSALILEPAASVQPPELVCPFLERAMAPFPLCLCSADKSNTVNVGGVDLREISTLQQDSVWRCVFSQVTPEVQFFIDSPTLPSRVHQDLLPTPRLVSARASPTSFTGYTMLGLF